MNRYKIVGWPDIQDLMDNEGFRENSAIIEQNDDIGIGSSTYLVNRKWLDKFWIPDVKEKIKQECKPLIDDIDGQIKRRGYAKMSFCDNHIWDTKTVHMDFIEKHYIDLGFSTRKELNHEVWDLYVKVKF